jgi:hypothetical protein
MYTTTPNRYFATLECICGYQPNAPKSYLDSVGNFMVDVLELWSHANNGEQDLDTTPRPHFAKSWYKLPDNCKVDDSVINRLNVFRSSIINLFKSNILAFQKFRQLIDSENRFYGGLIKRLDEEIQDKV